MTGIVAHHGLLLTAASVGPTDPLFAYVQALLHLDGANGSTTIVNNAPGGAAFSVAGSAALSTAQAKFGPSSLAGGRVSTSNVPPGFNTNGVDYCYEFWIFQATNATSTFARLGNTSVSEFFVGQDGTGKVRFWIGFSGTWSLQLTTTSTLTLGAWNHVACVKNGTTFAVYINGTSGASGSTASTIIAATSALYVGGDAGGSLANGYTDEVRYTVGPTGSGAARYTTNFTPPTAAFPNS